jgi:hypothetical protein
MRLLLLLLEDRFGDVANAVDLRPVDLRLGFGLMPRRCRAAAPTPRLQDVGAHTLGFIRLDRARMRLLLGNPDCCESIQNFLALDFQLSR